MMKTRKILLFFLLAYLPQGLHAQKFMDKRPTLYGFTGTTGANIRQFNELLKDRGLDALDNQYITYGLGYQSRINDFVLGFEISTHQNSSEPLSNFRIDYRTTRALLNIGYSLTEEGRFQLIHYMSLGMGSLNFQMLSDTQSENLDDFLKNPKQGFILRKNDIQKGTSNFGDFLTEIGFQASYDVFLPGRKEAIQLIAKAGYSFSPFEGSWSMNGIAFDNIQSGAFLRLGAGISLPDYSFFYKDASINLSLIRGIHFNTPKMLNESLVENGLKPFEGKPTNIGLRILGETDGILYGVDVFNLGLSGQASDTQTQTLNSLRVYGSGGLKVFQLKNFALGALAGLGFGNTRYTLLSIQKPNFPELFDQRLFDGYLTSTGGMFKPEVLVEYGLPMTKRKLIDLVFTGSAGYELAFTGFKLGDVPMNKYLSGPFITFGVGIRP